MICKSLPTGGVKESLTWTSVKVHWFGLQFVIQFEVTFIQRAAAFPSPPQQICLTMISLGLTGFPPSTHLTNQHSISSEITAESHPKGLYFEHFPLNPCAEYYNDNYYYDYDQLCLLSYGIIQKILLSFVFSFTYLPKHTPKKHSQNYSITKSVPRVK